MKAIINGKTYNTETAEQICNYWNGLGDGDFNNLAETLYRTKNGAWFMEGNGGAMTKYSSSNGNTSWGDHKILAITESEAKEFLEEHAEADLYIEVFGEIEA